MANFEKTEWGYSLEIIKNVTQDDGLRIVSAGVNFVKPGGVIPLHPHHRENEEYVPQMEGFQIVVMSQEEAEKLTESEVMDRLKAAEESEVGCVIICHKGEAHALYNASDYEAAFVFIKYE